MCALCSGWQRDGLAEWGGDDTSVVKIDQEKGEGSGQDQEDLCQAGGRGEPRRVHNWVFAEVGLIG